MPCPPLRPAGLLLLLSALLAGCGKDADDPRASHQAAFDATMRAVADADLDALWPLLTEGAREGVERELRTWQRRFGDPEEGLFLRQQIRKKLGPVGEDRFELASKGSLRDVFSLMMEADPRPADPPQRAVVLDPGGREVKIRYLVPSGDEQKELEAVLVRKTSGWYVASLQL